MLYRHTRPYYPTNFIPTDLNVLRLMHRVVFQMIFSDLLCLVDEV